MSEPVLHHFDASPFSEKVRLMFGLKGLTWRSVEISSLMPKPDYTPLTGGYRRTPSLQIGADIYCDTQVILAEIERRWPEPRAVQGGMDWATNWWADRLFFQTTVPIIFGALGDQVPATFIKDREELSGRPFDQAAMRKASPMLKGQWRGQARWIEDRLTATGSGWLGAQGPGLSDIAAYMNIWFLGRNLPEEVEALTQGMPAIGLWRERVAAIGHGKPVRMEASEALDLARASSPAAVTEHDPADPLGLEPGDPVVVMADDYGRDPVRGALVAANAERVVLVRSDVRTGPVHVHFPRAGYFATRG